MRRHLVGRNVLERPGYPKRPLADRILHHPAGKTLGTSPHQGCRWWVLRFDGGVDGNGAAWCRGRWAFVIRDGDRRLKTGSERATGEPVTVNTCEWEGLYNGLLAVPAGGPPGLLIEGDSDLVISQLTGVWQTKPGPLLTWRDRCLELLTYVPWFARWIPREQNTECDWMTKGPRS